jgi:hypothetical protein
VDAEQPARQAETPDLALVGGAIEFTAQHKGLRAGRQAIAAGFNSASIDRRRFEGGGGTLH